MSTRDEQVGGDHYRKYSIQPWDVIEAYQLDFWLGNVVKYVLRYRDKGGVEDLRKAEHYLKHAISQRMPVAKKSEDFLPPTSSITADAVDRMHRIIRERAQKYLDEVAGD